MKLLFCTVCALCLVIPVIIAQGDPGPSPTESIGCVPHGDHWDCEGPAPGATATATNAEHDDDEHDHAATGSLPPSPDGPVAATTPQHHDDSEHAASGSLPPSPTESFGCEPHGDHWDCIGPVTAPNAVTTAAVIATTPAANLNDNASVTSSVEGFRGEAPLRFAGNLGTLGVVLATCLSIVVWYR